MSDSDFIVRARVEAFLADYAHAIDADKLESWPDFFTQDAQYRVVTRENHERGLPLALMSCHGHGMMRDRIVAMRTANIYEPHVYRHIIGSTRIVASKAETITAESNFVIMRTMADGEMSVFCCGRSIDSFATSDGGLKFSDRLVILDSRRIDTLLVIPL